MNVYKAFICVDANNAFEYRAFARQKCQNEQNSDHKVHVLIALRPLKIDVKFFFSYTVPMATKG